MNSRERIISTIEHREPDRVAIDFAGTTVSGISAIAYNKLKVHFGVSSPTRVFDVVQQLAMPDPIIQDQFSSDTVDINVLFLQDMHWYPVKLTDGSIAEFPDWYKPDILEDGSYVMKDKEGVIMSKMAASGSNFDQLIFPYEDGYPASFDRIDTAFEKINWIAHSHSKFVEIESTLLRNRVSALRKSSDKALVMSGGAKLLELGFFLRRMDNFLMDLYIDKKNVNRLLDTLLDAHMKSLEKKLETLGDIVDVIRFGDDLGMTSGPLLERSVFTEFLKPRYKELCNFVKEKSKMKIFFHTCGSVRSLIPDLIECGFDILNPIQTNSLGMDPLELKQEFGNEICFWGGGIDTSEILPTGNPDEVRRDVLHRCEILSAGGGFVFAPIHNIVAGVPAENIIAAYNAVKEFNGQL